MSRPPRQAASCIAVSGDQRGVKLGKHGGSRERQRTVSRCQHPQLSDAEQAFGRVRRIDEDRARARARARAGARSRARPRDHAHDHGRNLWRNLRRTVLASGPMRAAAFVLAVSLLASTGSSHAADPAPSASASVMTLPDLAAKVTPSVVLLTVRRDDDDEVISSGSGFFVDGGGHIVTNHHVVEGAHRMKATLSDGREIDIRGVVVESESDDLAILKAEGSGYPPLALGDAKGLRVGDELAVIGSPKGLSATLTTGIVAAIRDKGLPLDDTGIKTTSWTLHFTAAIAPGSSGSPILSRNGEVVGVAVGAFTGAAGMSAAMSAVAGCLGRIRTEPAARTAAASAAERPASRTASREAANQRPI